MPRAQGVSPILFRPKGRNQIFQSFDLPFIPAARPQGVLDIIKEASKWLDQSLDIAETAFNLELKGDYYNDNRLPDKVLEYYVRTMTKVKENDIRANVTHIQKKIAKITNIGG